MLIRLSCPLAKKVYITFCSPKGGGIEDFQLYGVINKPRNHAVTEQNRRARKGKSLSQMEALTSPRSFLSLEHESSNSRRRKTRSRYYIHENARRLQRHPSSPPLRPLSTPWLPGSPLGGKRVARFALRFARNGATGCQERVLACCILQSEMVRPTGMNCVEVRPTLSDIDIFAFNV